MNAELVKRLLKSNQINIVDLNTFISEYVLEKKKRDVTPEELNGIVMLLNTGAFNLRFALTEAAKILGLTVLTATNNTGQIIYTGVY